MAVSKENLQLRTYPKANDSSEKPTTLSNEPKMTASISSATTSNLFPIYSMIYF